MKDVLPRLLAFTDDRVLAEGRVVERAAAMAAVGGARFGVVLRSRTLSDRALLEMGRALGAPLRKHGSVLGISGRADIARAVGATLVLKGRGAMSVGDMRRVAPGLDIASSVHDPAEVRQAEAAGADALIAGSIYPTSSHPGEPAGVALLRSAASTGKPVIAIGGLTPERVSDVVREGAWGVAAISALWDAPDPAAAARAFLGALPADDSIRVRINGEDRRARRGTSLAGLLADLALDPRAVVVEHNRAIVRREALATTNVEEGDALELVHFVGGG